MITANWVRIEMLYSQGVTVREIANILGVNEKTLSRRINKELKDYKHRHSEILKQKREFAKEDKKNGRKYIVDSSFIKWNKSIYRTNRETGDLEVYADCIVPIDVPESFENKDGKEYRGTFYNKKRREKSIEIDT